MNPFSKIKKLDGNKKKIFTNVFWAMLGKVINMAAALFVGILVARYLGPENYGVMNYVISYVALFTVFATFGMENIEIRELSKHLDKKESILGTCYAMRLFFAVIAYIAVVITLIIFKTDSFTTCMILAYSFTLFTNTTLLFRNYFTAIVQNKYVVQTEILRTFIGAAIKIALLWIKAPLEYFIYATIFDSVLVASGYYLCYKKTVGSIRNWSFDKTLVPFYIKESFPLVLSGAAVVVYQRIDTVMIGNMLDKTEVGYFSTAGKFVDLILFLPTVLVQTVTPMLVRIRENDPEQYEVKKRVFVSIIVWTSMLISIFVSLISYPLIRHTYGVEYLAAVPVLQIMAFKSVGAALSSSAGQIIILEGIQKWAFIRNILGCFICIGLNYLLIPSFGIIGSAIVTIITVLCTGCFANIVIPPYHKIMKLELYALFCGWKDLKYFKSIIKR